MGYPAQEEVVSLGDIIKSARERRGLSARALSVQAGLSPSYVSKLEAGEIEPSVRAFARLAYQLQMNPLEVYFSVMLERLRPMSPSPLARMSVTAVG